MNNWMGNSYNKIFTPKLISYGKNKANLTKLYYIYRNNANLITLIGFEASPENKTQVVWSNFLPLYLYTCMYIEKEKGSITIYTIIDFPVGE